MEELILWLDIEINDGERVRRIDRFVSYISIADDNDDIQHMRVPIKYDNDVRDMMYASYDIVFIVVCS